MLKWSSYGADCNPLHHYKLVSLLRTIYGQHKGSKMLFSLLFRVGYAPCWSDEGLSTLETQDLTSLHEHQM